MASELKMLPLKRTKRVEHQPLLLEVVAKLEMAEAGMLLGPQRNQVVSQARMLLTKLAFDHSRGVHSCLMCREEKASNPDVVEERPRKRVVHMGLAIAEGEGDVQMSQM